MNCFMALLYLFSAGSVIGWLLELGYNNLYLDRGHWVNPGFCTGPYIPIYGFGLCVLYLLTLLEQFHFIQNPFWNRVALFHIMAKCLTLVEYIAGVFCLRIMKVRLWDYSDRWGNIQGLICPAFSAMWAGLGAIYYFAIHPRILCILDWLSQNPVSSFFLGVYFGVFLVDTAHSVRHKGNPVRTPA